MFQFAAPLGLLALGAVLAPILIHLMRRPLRVVRVGNLNLLQGKRRPVWSLRWREWLLLALRCALLAVLALSLAGIRWQPRTPDPARWLLFVPGAILGATARAEWDRLHEQGFEPRILTPGFSMIANSEPVTDVNVDAWSLLRECDQRLPAGSRVVVFGPTWASQFRGERPVLGNVEVTWHKTAGASREESAPAPVRVGLVAASDRDDDTRYLRAAFSAIGATIVTDDAPEWIFQLGDVALPHGWREHVQRGARLISDAPDSAPRVEVNRLFEAGAVRVPLRQRVVLDAGVALARDSAGEPWITESRVGQGRHWRFALRFHPDWSDWPITSAFPAWWRERLRPLGDHALTIAPEDAAPRFAPMPAGLASSRGGYAAVDLRGWAWLVAAALFCVERAWSRSAWRRRMAA